jgi:sporulation protein YlmC with PRC-barrel domain
MSSSGEGERFKIGAHVDATDGRCGRLTRLIFDPIADAITDLVVEPSHHEELARLVPLKLVASVEDDLIRLDCTKERFEQLDQAEETQFLPANETELGYGDGGASWPYYALAVPLGRSHAPMFSDRVPVGDVEIRRGDPVHAKDGWIGAVQGLVIDPADHHVTHVILQEGHAWARKQITIPIGVANRVAGELRVDLSKDEIEALPPVSLRSHK